MIKILKNLTVENNKSVEIDSDTIIKYIGQTGTSGYASAAKGYIADYILRNIPVSWQPLQFDNSKNDKNYYVVDVVDDSHQGVNECRIQASGTEHVSSGLASRPVRVGVNDLLAAIGEHLNGLYSPAKSATSEH